MGFFSDLGSGLTSLAGGAIGFMVGGPAGAAIGAGLGAKAGGASTEQSLLAGGLGYLGGGYLGGAGAGAGELVGPMTAGELGAGFEGYMSGLGYTPLEGAMMGPLLANELGAGFGGYESAIGGFGAPVVDMSGAGIPGTSATAQTGSQMGMGDLFDVARRKLGSMGYGNLFQAGAGLYGLGLASQMRGMAQDPNAAYRPGYAAQLSALAANPNQIQMLPGYRAGLQAVQRSMAAQGYQGSGNMMAALAKYGAGAYNDRLAQLERLSGITAGPGAYLQGSAMANLGSLSSLGLLAGAFRG